MSVLTLSVALLQRRDMSGLEGMSRLARTELRRSRPNSDIGCAPRQVDPGFRHVHVDSSGPAGLFMGRHREYQTKKAALKLSAAFLILLAAMAGGR
jgi:hypothetical protein